MTWWEAALLGIVQGLTEFLPVSSSGHLVVGQHLLNLDAESIGDVTFEVFVHFGTVLSILTVYWNRVWTIVREFITGVTHPSTIKTRYEDSYPFRTALYILLTVFVTGIAYVLFGEPLEAAFDNPRLVAGMWLVTGTLLLLTLLRKNPDGPLTARKALVVGIAQSIAMMPGISRSGATICTALYQNVEPEKAADFSFLMLLPVVLGATLLSSLEMFETGMTISWLPLLVGTLAAYVSGVLAIRATLRFVSKGTLWYFAFYCYIIGVIGLIFL